jgi:hypothetical protein
MSDTFERVDAMPAYDKKYMVSLDILVPCLTVYCQAVPIVED